jgi:hypothetical protein
VGVAEANEREFRRFTAIALVHPGLRSPADVSNHLDGALAAPERVLSGPDGWTVTRMEYTATRKFYRENVGSDARNRDGGYAHDVYIATKDFGGRLGPVLLLASPYVRFLEAMQDKLTSKVTRPAIQYIAVDMPAVYAALDESGENAAVNRVTMQVIGEKNADLVSLSGKKPLHSNIHTNLLGITKPYGIGIRVDHGGADCRVGLTRHGRINWFQTTEDRVAHPLALLDRVYKAKALLKVRRYPLIREPQDDIVTQETE